MRHDDIYKVRWREGWDILTYLYRHPTDTAQIARVIEALQGRSVPRMMQRLRSRPLGRNLLRKRPRLREALADRAWLASLPADTLGRAYLAHVGPSTGMTGYVDEGTTADRTRRLPDDERFIQDYLFHCHDLFHIVTGYQIDLVGEVCLLAFTAAQLRNTGVIAMALLGVYSLRLPRLRGQRLWLAAAVRGQRAAWLVEQDWVALLARPIDDIRKQLGLHPTPVYTPLFIRPRTHRRETARAA